MTFAYSISVYRKEDDGSLTVNHSVGCVPATSHDEAVGKVNRICDKFYPHKHGWIRHLLAMNTDNVSEPDDAIIMERA